jgi:energy-coupling factor transporter ATP-binding protein EcfA2
MTAIVAPRVSPFSTGKWEYESTRHFYHLDSHEYRTLVSMEKHVFVIGHRGTGKTTLLKAIDWRERLADKNLQVALNGEPFRDGIIGCYVGLKNLSLPLFDLWLEGSDPPTKHLVLSAYIRSIWIEEAAKAVRQVTRASPSFYLEYESEPLDPVAEDFRWWSRSLNRTTVFPVDPSDGTVIPVAAGRALSLREIQEAAGELRDYLFNQATLGITDAEAVVTRLRLNRLQQLTNLVFRAFADILALTYPDRIWRFRVCLDESEFFTDSSRLTVRTMVRECESPLLLVVSTLSDLGVDTIARHVRLTLSDRELINLDARKADEMQSLVDGIVSARLAQTGYPCDRFSLASLLGEFDLNDLLLANSSSETNEYRAFRARAERSPGRDHIRVYLEEQKETAPRTNSGFVDRRNDSIGYRKKKLPAYLRMCATFGLRSPIYAGARITRQMADNSIRDLLQLLELLRLSWIQEHGVPADGDEAVCGFIGTVGLPVPMQDNALRELGRKKLDNFSEKVLIHTANARSLVSFFSKLAHRLCFDTDLPLWRAEATRFVVRLPVIKKNGAKDDLVEAFVEMVEECSREGFLRIKRSSPSELEFRVHASLARTEGFSYREGTYETVLPWRIIEQVITASSMDRLDRLVDESLPKRRGGPSQLPIDF